MDSPTRWIGLWVDGLQYDCSTVFDRMNSSVRGSIASVSSSSSFRSANALSCRFMFYVRSQGRGAIYYPEGFARFAARVLSGSLVLPR